MTARIIWKGDSKPETETQDKEKNKFIENAKKYAVSNDLYYGASDVADSLPRTLYNCIFSQQTGAAVQKIVCDTDNLISLQDSPSLEVLDEIKKFWELKENFAERGFLHKRGVLLIGPPGSGKTATIQQLIKFISVEYNGIAVYGDNPKIASSCLQLIRRIEPSRPIIMLFEDFDSLVEQFGENEYLALFDGESQVNNIVFIATSNYAERLDKRFTNRPSRFDLIKKIEMPSGNIRREYIKVKVPDIESEELDKWVELSEGYSFAHIRELIILSRCYGKTIEEATKRLNEMREGKLSSNDFDDGIKNSFGFTR